VEASHPASHFWVFSWGCSWCQEERWSNVTPAAYCTSDACAASGPQLSALMVIRQKMLFCCAKNIRNIALKAAPLNIEKSPLWCSGQSSWLYNGDVLCLLWGTNWICICYVEENRPPLWSSGQSSWLHNGDVLCFLWGTNWICICYVEENRPPLWSSCQSPWLQIQRPCEAHYTIIQSQKLMVRKHALYHCSSVKVDSTA
jgi:hypothetical protein